LLFSRLCPLVIYRKKILEQNKYYRFWKKLTYSTIGIPAFLAIVSVLLSVDNSWSSSHIKTSERLLSPANIINATAGKRIAFLEDSGVIKIESVFEECGKSTSANGEELPVVLQGTMSLPNYVTNATVVLNGWKLKYLDDDRHVNAIGVRIKDIELTGSTLNWNAVGSITDKSSNDSFEFCYYYTVIGWNASEIDAVISHSSTTSNRARQETTAQHVMASYIKNDDFLNKNNVATLPAGFGFSFNRRAHCLPTSLTLVCKFDEKFDHHILQIAYNLGRGEQFLEFNKKYSTNFPSLPSDASFVNNGYVSWESDFILKDNKFRRDVRFGENVSVLVGNDIGVIKPPFSILPAEDSGRFSGCVPGESTVKTDVFVVENIPYEYAAPLLTGWDLQAICDDKDVREVGIWLHDITYEKQPGAPVGTLRYSVSSVFRKKSESHFRRQNISILGIRPIPGLGTSLARKADLVPVRDETNGYCVFNKRGQLVITVNNQGNSASPASTTRVDFASGSVGSSIEITQALASNESSDVIFDIPVGCSSGDCRFKISVDSSDQVDEFTESNNTADGICIG